MQDEWHTKQDQFQLVKHKMQPNKLLNKVIEKLQLIYWFSLSFVVVRETDHIWL